LLQVALLIDAQRFDEAITITKKALILEPRNAGGFYNIGQAYFIQHLFKEARQNYQKALDCNPRMSDAWNGLAGVSEAFKDFSSAEVASKDLTNPEVQDNTVEIDPAHILEQAFKSKPDTKDSEIEQRIKEKRNRDKYRQRTRVIRTVEKGDTLKSISMGFFGED